jgi:hypothetical protein
MKNEREGKICSDQQKRTRGHSNLEGAEGEGVAGEAARGRGLDAVGKGHHAVPSPAAARSVVRVTLRHRPGGIVVCRRVFGPALERPHHRHTLQRPVAAVVAPLPETYALPFPPSPPPAAAVTDARRSRVTAVGVAEVVTERVTATESSGPSGSIWSSPGSMGGKAACALRRPPSNNAARPGARHSPVVFVRCCARVQPTQHTSSGGRRVTGQGRDTGVEVKNIQQQTKGLRDSK